MHDFIDAYAVLGVDPSADQTAIKARYRLLATRNHPDRAPAGERQAATARMQRINVAYGLLAEPAARREYDRLHAQLRTDARAESVDLDELWAQLLYAAGRWVARQRSGRRDSWYRAGYAVGRWLRG